LLRVRNSHGKDECPTRENSGDLAAAFTVDVVAERTLPRAVDARENAEIDANGSDRKDRASSPKASPLRTRDARKNPRREKADAQSDVPAEQAIHVWISCKEAKCMKERIVGKQEQKMVKQEGGDFDGDVRQAKLVRS
jgi:hypothetical protein